MHRVIALGIVLSVVMTPPVFAADNETGAALLAATAGTLPSLAIAGATETAAAPGGGLSTVEMFGATHLPLTVFGALVGLCVWREIATDPAKQGLYRWNHQAEATGGNRKWETVAGQSWRRLKAYKTAGGPVMTPLPESEYHEWQPGPGAWKVKPGLAS